MSILSFAKYQGAGNDFILIDDREGRFPAEDSLFIRKLCHRQFGIGADGFILLCLDQSDFRMRIFNSSDGREATSCGNGLRCLVKFLQELGVHRTKYKIKTKEKEVVAFMDRGDPVIDLGPPEHCRMGVETEAGTVHYLDTGAPHVVQFVSDVDAVDVPTLGPLLRHRFQANVNFAAVQQDGSIHVRTFEKGVEGETLSCGTGAAAVAAFALRIHGFKGSIPIHCRGGRLVIWEESRRLYLSGPASKVFAGCFSFETSL